MQLPILRTICQVFSVLASLFILAACSGEEGRCCAVHIPGFDERFAAVMNYDTAGFSLDYKQLEHTKRQSVYFGEDYQSADPYILQAWYGFLSFDEKRALSNACAAIDALNAIDDTASVEWQRLSADMEYVVSRVWFEKDSTAKAFEHLQRGLNLARSSSYSICLTHYHVLLARACQRFNDIGTALSHLRDAEIILDTIPENSITHGQRVIALTQCAEMSISLGEITQSDRLLAKSSLLYDKVTDYAKMAYCRQIVRFRFLFQQYSQAAAALNKFDMLVSKNPGDPIIHDVAVYQGLSRCRLGELEWAENFCEKVDDSKLSSECLFLHTLLRGEICVLKRQYAKAKAYLFDSVTVDFTTEPFRVAMANESRVTFFVSQGLYDEALAVMNDNRNRVAVLHNDYFAVNNRLRDESIRRAQSEIRMRAQEAPVGPRIFGSHLAFVVVQSVLFFIIIGVIAYYIRWRAKRLAQETAKHNETLKLELNKKIAQLEHQSEMIEATNTRIAESINYAEHIQHSISPDPEMLNKYPITGSFVFYSPLDIVSGDFLWFTQKGDYLIVCCADCTGHGVPGAFMSMIATTIINEICDRIKDNNVDPAAMLESLDHGLVANLAHNRGEAGASKDGLDIAIAALNLVNHKLIISSARRPAVILCGEEMVVVKGTKRSIGDLEPNIRVRKFENTTLQLAVGDAFYLYSDGYSDQFGGRNGSKMKSSRVENFLAAIHSEDMDEQGLTIQEFFIQWKGDYPQIDDVLFVGIKV